MNDGSLTRILSASAGPQAISYTMEFCGLLLSNDIGLCYGHKSYAEHVNDGSTVRPARWTLPKEPA